MASEQAKELRKQGIAAAKAGQKDQARQLLQQSLRLDPGSEVGWLWLASVAQNQRERLFCLHKLLEVNPSNEMALQSLQSLGITREQLAQQMQQGQQVAPSPSAAPPTPTPIPAAQPRPAAPPQAPGVPLPDAQRVAQLQPEVDSVVREYLAPSEGYPGIKWVQKAKGRAGERDETVLRAYIASGIIAVLVFLGIIGWVVVLNTPALRGIVFVPTPTLTRTPLPPTATFTPTPGVTPTPSPTPALTLTPSPTVPPQIQNGAAVPPKSTEIYPLVVERGILGSINLIDRQKYAEAIPTLVAEVTLSSISFDPQPYYFQALALAGKGDLQGARQILQDAERRLSEKPGEPTYAALVNAGLAYIDFLDAQKAVAEGDRSQLTSLVANIEDHANPAMDTDPRLAIAYLALAGGYRLTGSADQAIAILDRGLAVPNLASNTLLIVQKAQIYFDQKEYDLADYQTFLALYIDPTTESAHLLGIQIALAQNDPGLAVLRSQAYLYYYPGSAEGYKLLADARVAEGKPDLALESYSQALQGGDNAAVLVARAALYTSQRRYEQARTDLTKALTLDNAPQTRALRMIAAYNAGNLATASSDAEALLGQGVVSDDEIKLLQARILVDRAGDYQQALDLLSSFTVSSLPNALQPVADEYLARAQYNLDHLPDALKAIDRSLSAADTGSAHYWRGVILEAQGETAAALREYDWVLTLGQIYPYTFLPDVESRIIQIKGS